jgi:hypothetical protein
MFTTAGFNVNRLKMFILDDADPILRYETKSCVFLIAYLEHNALFYGATYR